MNCVNLMGNIGKDIELKTTQSGKSVCSFSLAVADSYDRQKTNWFDVVAWGKTAEFVSQYFRKGSKAAITGRLDVRSYQDKSGNNRTKVEVIAEQVYFCERREQKPEVARTESNGFQEIEENDDFPW